MRLRMVSTCSRSAHLNDRFIVTGSQSLDSGATDTFMRRSADGATKTRTGTAERAEVALFRPRCRVYSDCRRKGILMNEMATIECSGGTSRSYGWRRTWGRTARRGPGDSRVPYTSLMMSRWCHAAL